MSDLVGPVRASKSDSLRHFGWRDFDRVRVDKKSHQCPVQGCSATLLRVPYGARNKSDRKWPWCPEHGIRVHTNTFAYWDGNGLEDEARLRNFIVRPDLVCAIAFAKGMKAEAHRLGHEMSEDALSWNVFVSLAVAGQLREVAQHLIGRPLQSEPALYLWGHHIDLRHRDFAPYPELLRVRDMLEKDIHKFQTEPDIMLIAPNEMLICIEAKFGSGNPLAHDSPEVAGVKPTTREGLLKRYLSPSEYARQIVLPDRIGMRFHSQLFRNIVFACEMAGELPWHVVNLVSNTQSKHKDNACYSFSPPTKDVRCYLVPERQHCFTYRTWEGLYAAVIRGRADLDELDVYLRGKSTHYRRAFELG
jgi:hypothetical protein